MWLRVTSTSISLQKTISSICVKISSKMQCIRGKQNHSPPLTPIQSSVSLNSYEFNEYISKRINRKSLMRRSFEFVRKNFVRQSQYVLPKHRFKVRNVSKRHRVSNSDLNNNESNSSNSQILAQTTNTYGNGGDVFVISTDSDILTSNTNSQKQFHSNVRWVFQ